MGFQSTFLVIAVALAIAVFCGWRGARVWTIVEGPRMIPWRFLMLLAAAVAVLMARHALELWMAAR